MYCSHHPCRWHCRWQRLLSFWDLSHWQQVRLIEILYQANKVLVTFSGMCVLGMWLRQCAVQPLRFNAQSATDFFIEGWLRFCCVLPLIIYLPIPQQTLTYAVMLMFFLLPPAANIVALETHYQGTGHSAKYIASGTLASAILDCLIWGSGACVDAYAIKFPFLERRLERSRTELLCKRGI